MRWAWMKKWMENMMMKKRRGQAKSLWLLSYPNMIILFLFFTPNGWRSSCWACLNRIKISTKGTFYFSLSWTRIIFSWKSGKYTTIGPININRCGNKVYDGLWSFCDRSKQMDKDQETGPKSLVPEAVTQNEEITYLHAYPKDASPIRKDSSPILPPQ